jgi:hypothetical protein
MSEQAKRIVRALSLSESMPLEEWQAGSEDRAAFRALGMAEKFPAMVKWVESITNEQRLKDLEEICWHLLETERERDKPQPPGYDPFGAALDELEHFLIHGKSEALELRRKHE